MSAGVPEPTQASPAPPTKPAYKGWAGIRRAFGTPSALTMAVLGFGCGLPFLPIASMTLSTRLRDSGLELHDIGLISLASFFYLFKFLWAPLVDKTDAPLFGRWLGRRRGWMLLAQLVVAAALVGMVLIQPREDVFAIAGIGIDRLLVFGALALAVAFASATQDIVIDAWRIESASSNEQQGLLTSSSTLGYRGALLVTDALILIMAAHIGWSLSYLWMAALMGVGVIAVMIAREPDASRVSSGVSTTLWTPRGLFELKYFFSSHVGTATGGECSSTAIRAMIKKLIAVENQKKPLSDNAIAKLLQDEGIDVARRTVAKYRESLNIPSSSDRKVLL